MIWSTLNSKSGVDYSYNNSQTIVTTTNALGHKQSTTTDYGGNVIKSRDDVTSGMADFKSAGFSKMDVDVRTFDGYDSTNGVFKGYQEDFKNANKIYDTSNKESAYTWHHNEDTHTLQLVDRNIHAEFKHRGGLSVLLRGF